MPRPASASTSGGAKLAPSGGPPGGFGGGPGGGPGAGRDYSSPVIADGKIYYVTRSGECFVLKPGDEFAELARNRFETDDGDFSATPAISNGELFIRSSKRLYCVAAKS